MGCCGSRSKDQSKIKNQNQLRRHLTSHHSGKSSAKLGIFGKQTQTETNFKQLFDGFFKKYDQNQDGFLNQYETKKMLIQLYSHSNKQHAVTDVEVQEFLRKVVNQFTKSNPQKLNIQPSQVIASFIRYKTDILLGSIQLNIFISSSQNQMGCCTSHPAAQRATTKQQSEKMVHLHTSTSKKNQEQSDNRASTRNSQTQAELKELLSQFFDKYDLNKDGFLDRNETEKMLKDLYSRPKYKKHTITNEDAMDFIKSIDSNKDKLINKNELYKFYKFL